MIFILVSVAHLMYGNCQTTKFHFMVQVHYMPEYLPNRLLKYNKESIDYLFGDKNYSGKWRTWYKNGVMESEGEYKTGNLNGKLTKWYESGAKKSESEWINGMENGTWYYWHENGALKSKWEYKMANLDGKYINWDLNGIKIKEQDWQNGLMIKEYLSPTK
jgi:antitoxin component YwqK of YwqJK toxin-antitoxin module